MKRRLIKNMDSVKAITIFYLLLAVCTFLFVNINV